MSCTVLDKDICDIQKQIFIFKNYLMCLHKRLYLIRTNYILKSEYEKNEVEIIAYQTKHQIAKYTKYVDEMEINLFSKMQYYFVGINEIEEQFELTIKKAKKLSFKDIGLKMCIKNAHYNTFNEKVQFYLNLKNILYTSNTIHYD